MYIFRRCKRRIDRFYMGSCNMYDLQAIKLDCITKYEQLPRQWCFVDMKMYVFSSYYLKLLMFQCRVSVQICIDVHNIICIILLQHLFDSVANTMSFEPVYHPIYIEYANDFHFLNFIRLLTFACWRDLQVKTIYTT